MLATAPLQTATDTAEIARRIDADGYAVIEGYIPPAELGSAQEFVRQAVARNGGNYLSIRGANGLEGTFLHSWPEDADFIALCHAIYERTTGKVAPDAPFYQVLRCLSGRLAAANSLNFHYDSYLLTALIPIIIPERGKTGDLLIMPNSRKLRSSYALNFIDKILLDNPLSQKVLRARYERGHRGIRHLKLTPGNLYLFNGYRSIHTNEACDPDAIRSTALLHYVDPHADSALKHLLRRQ
ncbi:hypothetical protein [Bosea sp. NBC_00550]|uniref:hypothetical protein n=1 Tax=Bosea sp. NBC_00550 TaxID=2969621 RepID=UPI00222E5B3E|nr:hypothetical protein [Bosea sp. NBC_00550]UZF93167.1 hypothetical protein NWE53_02815 [Bosea sp. NBC_00550]